jgi:BirA family biotin operon repressor/biotin-[acetyl-CoA-carboxylase] ligase
VGLALAQSLESAGFAGIGLKWPNDLTHDGAKLGGILVELSGDALGPSLAIIGIGVNVRLSADARRAIEQPATDLASIRGPRALDRNLLLARMLTGLAAMLQTYASEGFAPLRAEWQRRHVLHDRPVEVRLPDGGMARGRVAGVDADGALLLDSGSRRLRLVSGEVSLIRARR